MSRYRGKDFCAYFNSSLLDCLPKGQKAYLTVDRRQRKSCDDFVSFYRIVTQDGSNFEETKIDAKSFVSSSYFQTFQTVDLKQELYGAQKIKDKWKKYVYEYFDLIFFLQRIAKRIFCKNNNEFEDEKRVTFDGIEPSKNRKLIVVENLDSDKLKKLLDEYDYYAELLETSDDKYFIRFPKGISTLDFLYCLYDIDDAFGKSKPSELSLYAYLEPHKMKNVTGNLCMVLFDDDAFWLALSDDGKAWVESDEDCELGYEIAWKETSCCTLKYKPYPAEELVNAKIIEVHKGEEGVDAFQDELWDK